jgi:hypothetical protein
MCLPLRRGSASSRGKRLAGGIDISIPILRMEELPAIHFEAQEYGGVQRPQQQFITGSGRAVADVSCATMDEDRVGAPSVPSRPRASVADLHSES